MDGFLVDLRFGLRQLASRPVFAAAAILTLALGIGANTAVFSILSAYLFKPLPYPQSSKLIVIHARLPKFFQGDIPVSLPMYAAIREQDKALSATAALDQHRFNLQTHGSAALVDGVRATASLFKVLNVKPYLGKTFAPNNNLPGRGRVAVISYKLWQGHFGGGSDIVGTTVKLDGQLYRVAGVMPQGFFFPNKKSDVWVPLTINPGDQASSKMFNLHWSLIGRLKPKAHIETLKRQLGTTSAHIIRIAPDEDVKNSGFRLNVDSFRHVLQGDKTTTLWLLQGAVLLILLITCVNVANLLLSNILGRSHEMAMRCALGATRATLARQLLLESGCLAVPGGVIGIALGWVGLHFLTQSSIGVGNGAIDIALDWRVGLFTLGAICITLILIITLPVRHLAKIDLHSLLQEGGLATTGGRRAWQIRSMLVTVELTLATALLAASGLLLHSFINLSNANTGFRKDNILIASLAVPPNDRSGNRALSSLYAELKQRTEALPGVQSAGLAKDVPMIQSPHVTTLSIRGHYRATKAEPPSAVINPVDNGYFRALRIPLLQGRNFGAQDRQDSQPVAIVDQRFARRYFKDTDPVGQQIKLGEKRWYTIVGIAPTIKYAHIQEYDKPLIYLNVNQAPDRDVRLVIHTSIPPNVLANPLRRLIRAVDPAVAVSATETMRDRLADSLKDKEATMELLVAFGGIALALAVVGIYGVLNSAVNQRVKECGVRLALGARPVDLLWLIVKDGMKLSSIGLVIGLALAVIFGFVLSSRLFGVAPFDPSTLIGVAFTLSLVTLLASYIPARRAAHLDPATALQKK